MMRVKQSTGQRMAASEIKQVLPNLSFAAESDLSEFGYPALEPVAQPDPIDADHRVIAGPDEEYEPGQWRQTWVQEPIPPAPVPEQVTRTQAFVALQDAQDGLITDLNDTDAEGNPVPRFPTLANDVLAWGKDPARTLKELGYFDSPTWNRTDPLLAALGLAFGLSEPDKDALFLYAASI